MNAFESVDANGMSDGLGARRYYLLEDGKKSHG